MNKLSNNKILRLFRKNIEDKVIQMILIHIFCFTLSYMVFKAISQLEAFSVVVYFYLASCSFFNLSEITLQFGNFFNTNFSSPASFSGLPDRASLLSPSDFIPMIYAGIFSILLFCMYNF
jgi:hypothetical protein